MASGQTSRYGLSQWQPEDKVLREEFNGDNGKVDAALGGLADQMNTKAGQADLDGVKTQLATKAAQSALDSLSASVTAGLAKKYGTDFPYITTGNYTGDGAATRSITLGFQPSVVLLFSIGSEITSRTYLSLVGDSSFQMVFTHQSLDIISGALNFVASGFQILLESDYNETFNESGWNYHYIAFR